MTDENKIELKPAKNEQGGNNLPMPVAVPEVKKEEVKPVPLTPEEIKFKRYMINQLKLENETMAIDNGTRIKIIEGDVQNKTMRLKIQEAEMKIETNNRNIKVLEKQIAHKY